MSEAREYLIRNGGYYYRPNSHGYTTRKVEAGRYTKAEADAEAAVEPWHMSAIHQDEIPDEPEIIDRDKRIEALEREASHWLQQARDNLKAGQDCLAKLEAAEEDKARLSEALRPFADMADYLDSETEGFSETDEFDLLYEDHLFHHFKVADFRIARAALAGSGSGWQNPLEHAVEFVAIMAWRTDPPNANNKLTDTERLSAIKYHPTIKHYGQPHIELAEREAAAPQQGGE